MKKLKELMLTLYFILLPIDGALGKILGNMTIVNYFILGYIFFSLPNIIKIKISRRKINIFIYEIIFIFYLSISIFWTRLPLIQIFKTSEVYTFILSIIFYLFLSVSKTNISKIFKYTYWSTYTVIIAAGYSYYLGTYIPDGHGGERLVLSFTRYFDPNYFISNLTFSFIILLNLFINKKKIFNKVKYLSLIICYIFIVLKCGSRTGMLGLLVGSLVFLFINRHIFFKKLYILYALISFTYLYISGKINKIFNSSYLERFSIEKLKSDGGSGRVEYWLAGFKYYKEHGCIADLIFGFGHFSFPIAPYLYVNHFGAPHNLYVQLLFETGILGSILFIIFVYLNYLHSKSNKIIMATFIGLLVTGIGLDSIRTRYFWTILALINILYLTDKGATQK